MIDVRPMEHGDMPACLAILNHIIAQGGTTAYETPFTLEALTDDYLHDPAVSLVAVQSGRVVAFQVLFAEPEDIYAIASFADQQTPVRGAGRALFTSTVAACRAIGGTAILARITSDNTGGLAYYSRMGFEDVARAPRDHIRADGTVVDRVIKRFDL